MVYMTARKKSIRSIKRFTQKYPTIKVEFTRDGSVEIAQR